MPTTGQQSTTNVVYLTGRKPTPEALSTHETSAEALRHDTPPEFDIPTTPQQRDALIGLIRLDRYTNAPLGEENVSPELAVTLFDSQLQRATRAYRNVHAPDSGVHGESDLLDLSLDAADAIAGMLATPMGITEPEERAALEQSLGEWLARAERTNRVLELNSKTHTNWDESLATIAFDDVRIFYTPNHGSVSYQDFMGRTLHRIDAQDHMARLQTAFVANNPTTELGKVLGSAFEHDDTHIAAGLQAKAFFEFSALPDINPEQKQWALRRANQLFEAAFANVPIDDDSPKTELTPEQAVQLRLYGQTIHDLADIQDPNPDGTDKIAMSMRARAVRLMQKSLETHAVYQEVLEQERKAEGEIRMDIAVETRAYDAEDFTRIRDELARLNVELFNAWIRARDLTNDLNQHGERISALNVEQMQQQKRLADIANGLPDPYPEQEQDSNPDDTRTVSERINTRLIAIASDLPRKHADAQRVGAEKRKHGEYMDELEKQRDEVAEQETKMLLAINTQVRRRLEPLWQKLREGRVGEIVPGNEAYLAVKDILRSADERNQSDYFLRLYQGELGIIHSKIEERKRQLAEAAMTAGREQSLVGA